MGQQAYFTPELFKFLRQLKKNNEREWFKANKQRYEDEVKQPMLRFIADFAPLLEKISPHYVADPRPVGGSLFRIYRDTRFSKDKTPYKIAAGAQFRHEQGKDVHGPCFYLHMEPGKVFAGAGIWNPDTATAGKIRDAIVADSIGWRTASPLKKLKGKAELHGESLKRPPRGYDPDHPLIEDLKRKSFMAMTEFPESDATAPGFLKQFVESCRAVGPYTAFITRAVSLPW